MLSRLKEEWLALTLTIFVISVTSAFCYTILLGFASTPTSTFNEANRIALSLLIPSVLWLSRWSWSWCGPMDLRPQIVFSLISWSMLSIGMINLLQTAHNAGLNEWHISIPATTLLLLIDGIHTLYSKRHKPRG
ncbi:hypothetical protein [Vibrio parahaemolyticus]|uniref:hypothetical protein n=1 Tax=Vibrio parahaemolyticus TaxID=670 RepID=UPI001123DE08|nr:hypothetical protein [Vibrio parahaemolyticus]TOG94901.1 hypothetical protein CGI92_15055 [Vibrio parahaemolyticus]